VLAPNAPVRARLWFAEVNAHELLLLQAMVEHCSDGQKMYASVARLAAYTKLSRRTVQRLLGKLQQRRILIQIAEADREEHRPATYRLNAEALGWAAETARYLRRPSSAPAWRGPQASGCHEASDRLTPGASVTVTPNPKALLYPTPFNSAAIGYHAPQPEEESSEAEQNGWREAVVRYYLRERKPMPPDMAQWARERGMM
jgi:DNA-binding transcriptional ArsR family regulator